jgi:hypothetical protein
MVGARLEGCAEWLAQGLRILPDGWREANIVLDGLCEANIALNGGASHYCAQWWHKANITLIGGARLILCLMVGQG